MLFLPVFVWFAIFCYGPMFGLAIAFKDFKILKGISGSKWVGLKNFHKLMTNPAFISAIWNTLIISGLKLFFSFPAPIIFAILLDEMRVLWYKKVVQTVSYLPHFISWAVAGGLITVLLDQSIGPVAAIVKFFGGKPQTYLSMNEYFRMIVLLSDIWKGLGWSAIIYIAAISGVDEQLYEAAMIDGAGRFQRIWHVTLPGIRGIIAIQLILQIGNILNVSFDQIYMLINTNTQRVGETIDYFIYRFGMKTANNFSIATAAGMLKSLIGFFLIILTNIVTKKLTDGEGIW